MNPSDKAEIQKMIDDAIVQRAYDVQFQVTPIPAHVHNGVDANRINAGDLIAGGTYTPTLTNVTNVASSTARICNYFIIDNLVTVSGTVTVDPTAASGTELGMSLPTPSRFVRLGQCAGVACSFLENQTGIVVADTTNYRASLQFEAVTGLSKDFTFTYTYQIV